MNCQEVIELMQRQLDQDLDADEEHLLRSHLKDCLDCALMFERLQLLSEELTKLPKVAPPYSLVDAILPRLSEMDTQAAASDHDVVVAPASTAKLPGAEAPKKLPWTHRFGSYVSWKLAGGVVAAGLAIGTIMVGMEPSSSRNADGLLQPSSASKESAASTAQSANDAKPAAPASSNDAGISSMQVMDQSVSYKAAPASGTSTPAATPVPEVKASTSGLGGGEVQRVAPVPAEEPQQQAGPKETSKPLEAADSRPEQVNTQELTPSSHPVASLEPKDTKTINKGTAVEEPPANSEALADKPVNKAKVNEEKNGMFGIMAMPSASPDMGVEEALSGPLYTALVDQHKVVIRNTKTNDVIFTSSKVWTDADTIVLVSWSEDNKLTYQVKIGEQTHTYVIELSTQTEILVSP